MNIAKNSSVFPTYRGEVLSWSIGLYHTAEQEKLGFPKMRAVIRAMQEHRPEQLERERRQLLKDSFGMMFGRNAEKQLAVVEEEIAKSSSNQGEPKMTLTAKQEWETVCEMILKIEAAAELAEEMATGIRRLPHAPINPPPNQLKLGRALECLDLQLVRLHKFVDSMKTMFTATEGGAA